MTEITKSGSAPAKIDGKLALTKAEQFYMDEVNKALSSHNSKLDQEQRTCVVSVLSKMQEACLEKGVQMNQMNQTGLMSILQQAAMLRLNAAANPRECYIIIRKKQDANGDWKSVFEFGIEGDGNDKLVRKYGVNVKNVHPYWKVREGDDFTYASFKGLEMEPPTWTPKGCTGKIVRIVYPVEYEDDEGNKEVQFHICEREEVAVNLKAHILNNIKKKPEKDMSFSKKEEIKQKLFDMSLDDIFNDSELLQIMSPAWRDPHSRESMIVRKMRNNCLKPIPKDFGSAFAEKVYDEAINSDEKPNDVKMDPEDIVEAEVNERTNTEVIDSLPGEISEEEPAEQDEPVKQVSDPF